VDERKPLPTSRRRCRRACTTAAAPPRYIRKLLSRHVGIRAADAVHAAEHDLGRLLHARVHLRRQRRVVCVKGHSRITHYAGQHPNLIATRPDTNKVMIRLDRPTEKTNQSDVDTTWYPIMSGQVGRTDCR